MLSEKAQQLHAKLAQMGYREQLMTYFEAPTLTDTLAELQASKFKRSPVTYHASTFQGQTYVTVAPEQSAPVGTLVLFHGGAFVTPATKSFREVALQFVQAGYQVVIPDYPLAPDVTAEALRAWVLAFYTHVFATTTTPIGLFGDSAGANLALRLRLDLADQATLPEPAATALVSISPDLTYQSPAAQAAAEQDRALDRTRMLALLAQQDWSTYSFPLTDRYPAVGAIRFDSGGNEFMAQDVVALATSLGTNPGSVVTANIHPELMHDFVMWKSLPEAQATIADLIAFWGENLKIGQK